VFFFQAEDGIRDFHVMEFRRVLFRSDLAELSPTRGCMIIKPWGMGIWENLRDELDRRIKASGHDSYYFPLLIPLSFFAKEAEHRSEERRVGKECRARRRSARRREG